MSETIEAPSVISEDKADQLIKKLESAREDISSNVEFSKSAIADMKKDLGDVIETQKKAAEAKTADEKRYQELQENYTRLEKIARRVPGSEPGSRRKDTMEKVKKMLINFEFERQEKVLATDSNVDGGFLKAPPEFVLEIEKDITEISPVLGPMGVKVRRTNRPEIVVPTRISRPELSPTGERKTGGRSEGSYGKITIKVHKQMNIVEATAEDLSDSAFDIETDLLADMIEDDAQKVGFQVFNGGGSNVNEANGILLNSDILANGVTNTGVLGGITSESILDFLGKLKTGYKNRSALWLNRQVLFTHVWSLKGTDGQFIFNFGNFAAAGGPNIVGVPIIEAPDMPVMANDAIIMAHADMRSAYTFATHTELTFKRDDFTKGDDDIVVFRFRRRFGGDVVKPEAIKLLKAST